MFGSQSSSESHSDSFKMMCIIYFEIQYGRTMFVILLWQLFHASRFFNHMFAMYQQTKVEVKPPAEHKSIPSICKKCEGLFFTWLAQSNPRPITGLPVMVQEDLDFFLSKIIWKSGKRKVWKVNLQGVRTGSTAIIRVHNIYIYISYYISWINF